MAAGSLTIRAELSFGKRSALVAKYCSVSFERVESSPISLPRIAHVPVPASSEARPPLAVCQAFHSDLDLRAPTRITPFMTGIYLSPPRMRYAFLPATAVTLRTPAASRVSMVRERNERD